MEIKNLMLENRYIAWLIHASMADNVASRLLRQLHIHYGRMEDPGARTLTRAKHSLAQQSTDPQELTAKDT
jgi:hypothetical protein